MDSKCEAKVTACVVVRDEEKTIERCLDALFRQELDEPFEIVLVDNASKDRTIEIAERVAATHADRSDVTFRIVERRVNNLGAARQNAVETANGSVVAFTDADCIVPPGWLATLTRTLREHRSRGVAAVGTVNRPPTKGTSFHEAQRRMFESFLGHFGSEQARPSSKRGLREVEHLPTCSVIYDRQELLDAGGFGRDHRLVCEDVDVSYRLRARDARLLKIETVVVEHHSKPSYRHWARKIFRYGWGQVQIMRKTPGHRRWKFALPVLFALSFPIAALLDPRALVAWTIFYVSALALLSLVSSAGRLALVARMIPLYAITHFSYGAGLLAGVAGWSGGRGPRG